MKITQGTPKVEISTTKRKITAHAGAVLVRATAEAGPVLEALLALPELMETRPSRRVPAGHLDADRVAAVVVPPAWRRVVFPPGRPEGTVHRAGYVFCVLEQFHQRLQRRDIFAAASSRWADLPRAQLLTGEPERPPRARC